MTVGCIFLSDGLRIWIDVDYADTDSGWAMEQLSYEEGGLGRWTDSR